MSDSEHLSSERISGLIEPGVADPDAEEHLAACARCRREQERMRRMRMALSALDTVAAPAGGWDRIEAALEERSGVPTGAPGGRGPGRKAALLGRIAASTPARAAAAVLLFGVGVGLGVHLSTGPSSPAGAGSAASVERAAGPGETGSGFAAPAGEMSDLRAGARSGAGDASGAGGLTELTASGPDPAEALQYPQQTAAHLARLDALIHASREALQEDPADPMVNDLLFQVMEEREQYRQALQLSSLEYR